MEFKDRFVEKYRIALHAARDGDTEGVINGLYGLYSLFEEQYKKNNGDSYTFAEKGRYTVRHVAYDTSGNYAILDITVTVQ